MTESQIYRQLLEKLTMQSFLPESGPKLMEILQIIFSPEEAELALGLPFPVTDVEEIAQSLGRTVEEIVPTLERMADKGLVYAGMKEGRKRYQLLVLFPGMIELQFMGEQRIRPEPGRIKLARVFDEFYQDIMKGLTSDKGAKEFKQFFRSPTPYSRVIPVESDIRMQSAIQPFEAVSSYIEDSKDMAIGNCYCRTIKGFLDQACDAPVDVWSDGTRLLVTDRFNSRVVGWNAIPQAADVPADFVLGQADFASNVQDHTRTVFNQPAYLASNGNQLAVADTYNNRVLVWNEFPTATGAPPDLVLGQGDFVHFVGNDDAQTNPNDPGTPTARTLNHPAGVAWADDALYVSDAYNSRVLVYRAPAP